MEQNNKTIKFSLIAIAIGIWVIILLYTGIIPTELNVTVTEGGFR